MVEETKEVKKVIKQAAPPTGQLPPGIIGEVRLKDGNLFNCTHILYSADVDQYFLTNEEGESIMVPVQNVSFIYHHKIA